MSIFNQFGRLLSRQNLTTVLQNHPQIPLIIDILSRQESQPVAIVSTLTEKLQLAFIEGVTQQLSQQHTPTFLQNYEVMYVDTARFILADIDKKQVKQDFCTLVQEKKHLILILSQPVDSLIQQALLQDNWRLMIFTAQDNSAPFFTDIYLAEPKLQELTALLKLHCNRLEIFHHVVIPEEIINQAFVLAEHYLPGHSVFDKALGLLDSAAARASTPNQHEQKTFVTESLLEQIVAHHTQIPAACLHHSKFHMQKLTDALRKQIFGQDAAINLLSSLLQNACIKLYDKAGPLCSFLLAGPHDTGKTAIAQAIAEYLVGTQDAVLKIDLNHPAGHSLQTIPILHKQHKHLVAAIQHMPYAIVLIEDIDQLPPNAITLIKQIFLHKNLFKHSIIIATTRLSNEKMQPAYPAENKNVDLMQILLNDNNNQQVTEFSLQELRDEMFPKLSEHLTADLLQHFNIIPLLPLDYAALEKIVRNKIKALSRHLHDKFGIELTCAPETIKFLAQEASWRNITSKSLDNLFEQHLYSTVMHQLLMQAENKDRSKRLLIQVNDSGTLLRCEFIAANEAALYSL